MSIITTQRVIRDSGHASIIINPFSGLAPLYSADEQATPTHTRASPTIADRWDGAKVTHVDIGANTPTTVYRKGDNGKLISGWLGEQERKNMLLQSFNIATTWGRTRLGGDEINDDALTGPNGSQEVDGIICNDENNVHRTLQTVLMTEAEWCVWAIMRAGTTDWVRLATTAGNNHGTYANLSTVALGSAFNSPNARGVKDLGDNFVLVWFTLDATAVNHTISIHPAEADNDIAFAGDNLVSQTYVYCAQAEAGPYPSSPILNTVGANTRAADPAIQYVNPYPDAAQGWMSFSVLIPDHTPGAAIPIIDISDGGAAGDRIRAQVNTDGDLQVVTAADGGNAGSCTAGAVADGNVHQCYVAWKKNYLCAWVDGTPGTEDTSVDIADSMERIELQPTGGVTGEVQIGNRFRGAIKWAALTALGTALLLPQTMYAESGTAFDIFHDGLVANPVMDTPAVSSPGGGSESGGKWTDTPTANMSISASAGESGKQGSLLVSSQSHTLARRILCVGDSITNASWTYVDDLKTLLGANWTMDGLVATVGGNKHEGHSGWAYDDFLTDASSPFLNASVLDVPNYLGQLDGTPDVVLFFLGTNDCFAGDPDDPDAVIDTMFDNADTLQDAFAAALPSTLICQTTVQPSSNSGALWTSTFAPGISFNHHRWSTIQTRLNERIMEERDNVVPIHLGVDTAADYTNSANHPNEAGHEAIAQQIYNYLIAVISD